MSWHGRCDRCGVADDLALEPGTERRICLACYEAAWEPPDVPITAEVVAGMKFAREWAALRQRKVRAAPAQQNEQKEDAMSDVARCAYCTDPIDPFAKLTWRRVVGWERKAGATSRRGGSDIVLRESRDEYAHDQCISKLKARLAPGQGSLLG